MPLSKDITDWLSRQQLKNFRLDLGPITKALQLFNNPQNNYDSIHIVGTNGKGSTAAFLRSLFMGLGYKTGLMTSPHLLDVRERIQIDHQLVSTAAFNELLHKIRNTLHNEDDLSYFEILTLAGFEYFSQMGIDIAIVEAGMGGRFDATNVLQPKVAVFTPISMDHEKYLGDTIEKIAEEKCAILKSDTIVVSAPQQATVAKIIEAHCANLKLKLHWADPSKITTPLGLAGQHQKANAATALLAAQVLLPMTEMKNIYPKTFQTTQWPGRLQYLQHNPTILIDGAHNRAGIETLANYLQEKHPHQKIHFLIGVLEDKNWETMFAPLARLAERFICVTPPTERGLPACRLATALKPLGKPTEVFDKPLSQVLQSLLATASPKDLFVATGSLYMIGDLLHVSSNTIKTSA
ncbi:MAG: folylpolyglutamate synthase/dihydrofolate synthase family protein [Deltaproteobacteria bacterium]|nr:folylpolyglutamate synthase/dihydrofolate synthase family protein [Deltaproteobacteria bacterium]